MFDLDDTLVDPSSALRAGAHAFADTALLDTEPEDFIVRCKAIDAEKYPRYLSGELRYEDMCRERSGRRLILAVAGGRGLRCPPST